MTDECPSAAHGTNRDPYGCHERERAIERRIDRAVESAVATAPHPARRLADRLLDSGQALAQQYAEQDRYDPDRPTLGVLVAETLATHERIGEERILQRVRDLIEQRTALRDERLDLALRYAREGNLSPAASELRWASDLDQQIGALRLLLVAPEPGSPS